MDGLSTVYERTLKIFIQFIEIACCLLGNSSSHEMIPVGDFQIKFDNATKEGEQVYVPRPGVTIKWPGGRTGPPRDSPECGFHGELCIEPIGEGNIC